MKRDPKDSQLIIVTFQFQSFRKTTSLFLKTLPSCPAHSFLDFTISFQCWLVPQLWIMTPFSFKLDEHTGLCRILSAAFSIYVFSFPFEKWFQILLWPSFVCVPFVLNQAVMSKTLKKLQLQKQDLFCWEDLVGKVTFP